MPEKVNPKNSEITSQKEKNKKIFSCRTLSEREHKNLLILDQIRKSGAISKSDISKNTSINLMSISNYIKEYLDRRLIVEKGFDVSSGGRRPGLVELNKTGVYIIGVEIGRSAISAVMTDLEINTIEKMTVERPRSGTGDIMLETTDIIKRMASDPKVANKDLAAIGIGAFCSDLHKVRDMVENKFKVATFAGNEALCAAFGEKMLNPNAGVENLLYMHSDIGCGIMVRGETYFSADNDIGGIEPSGEQISEDEIDSLLERSRYLKPWGGDFGMVYAARREIEKGVGTKIVALSGGRTEKISEDIVVEAALEKDDLAMSIVQTTAMSLGTRIAYLVNLFAAEAVIVGGAIRRAEEQLLGPIKNIVRKLAFKKYSDRVKIMTGALGKDAVSLGAASLAAREVFLSA